jgi:spore germination protein YaaH
MAAEIVFVASAGLQNTAFNFQHFFISHQLIRRVMVAMITYDDHWQWPPPELVADTRD